MVTNALWAKSAIFVDILMAYSIVRQGKISNDAPTLREVLSNSKTATVGVCRRVEGFPLSNLKEVGS